MCTLKTNVHTALARTVKITLPLPVFEPISFTLDGLRNRASAEFITNYCSEFFFFRSTKFQLLTFKNKKHLFISTKKGRCRKKPRLFARFCNLVRRRAWRMIELFVVCTFMYSSIKLNRNCAWGHWGSFSYRTLKIYIKKKQKRML